MSALFGIVGAIVMLLLLAMIVLSPRDPWPSALGYAERIRTVQGLAE